MSAGALFKRENWATGLRIVRGPSISSARIYFALGGFLAHRLFAAQPGNRQSTPDPAGNVLGAPPQRRLTFSKIVRWLRHPGVIVLTAMAFRILLIPWVLNQLGTPTNHFQGNEPSHIAAHLLRGEGFASPFTDLPVPTAQQPPLYPLFMAVIFRLFGAFSKFSLYALLAINALAGGLTALFLLRAALKHLSPQVALLSAWAWAIFPPIAVTDITLSSYAFATLAVVLWLNFIPDLEPRTRNWIVLGIAIALMLLLNPMLALLIPASICWLNRKQALVVLATAALGLAPWYVRNYYVMGHFYPALRDNFGMELYLGNHPGMSGTCDYWTGQSPYGGELPKVGEAQFFEARRRDAIAFIESAPEAFFVRSLKRFAAFWFSPWSFVYVILLVLSVWGIRLAPRGLGAFAATLFVLYPPVFYVTQAAWPTAYRHPIEPLMLLMAATAIAQVIANKAGWSAPAI